MCGRSWTTSTSPRTFVAPRVANDGAILRAGSVNPSITWIGHSTLLVQINGVNILTDPQWSERASPVSWGGPRRLSPPGLAFDDLPRIDVVLISHDHYDHLDLNTVKRLAEARDPLFLVPLGLKAWFAENGMTPGRRDGLVAGARIPRREIRLRAGAAFFPTNLVGREPTTLGVMGGVERRATTYSSGDTGYFAGFKEAGQRLGPFDIAAIAIGAYEPPEIMKAVHLTPEEAVQAFIDLKARVLLGIHWGTFDLAEEPLDEPPQRVLADIRRRNIDASRAWIFRLGETRPW